MGKFKSIVIVYRFLVIAGVAWGFLMLTGWSYPIKQVSKPLDECKSVHWDKMPEGCIIDLPKIAWGISETYKKDELYRLVYSDLWWGTYNDGRDTRSGSSPWVDIVTSKGTPVYAIADGTIVQASYKFGIGNSITIKHKYNGSYIYSSYSHLDEIYFKVGDVIKEGNLIGKVGNTGTTYGQYGNHLDFQLTTTTQWFYPYSYYDCNVGLSYYDIINSSLCRSYMIANTLDPIAFLESQGLSKVIASNTKNTAVETNSIVTTSKESASTITIKTPTQVHGAAPVTLITPTARSISTTKKYQYQVVGLASQESIEVKRKFVFFIKVYDVNTKSLYSGKLAHRIVVRDTNWIIAFDEPVITKISNGIAKITALWVKSWYTNLKVEIAGRELGSYGITLK